VIIKYGYGVWAAIYHRVGLILYNVCYAVACKTANSMLVDEPGRFVIVIVVVVCGGQEGLKIADEIKWEKESFLKA